MIVAESLQNEATMYDVFLRILEIQIPFNLAIIAVILGSLIAMVAIIAAQIQNYAIHRSELEAKRDMLSQGMQVDEIERVLEAGSGSGRSKKK